MARSTIFPSCAWNSSAAAIALPDGH
jgi:hypothetical protein